MSWTNSWQRTLIWNLAVFLFLIFLLELVLGEWLKFTPNVRAVPAAQWNTNAKIDVSKLYARDGNKAIEYTRDANGYRGFDRDFRPILLTIGGSTTDQRFVTDNETWQSILETELGNKFDVVNAGVDGQSTFGHLVSIRDWHSKDLKNTQVIGVLFYFGVNDGRLLIDGGIGLNEYDNLYASASYLGKIRILFSRNSFFYAQLRQLMRNLFSQPGARAGGVQWAGHQSGIKFIEPESRILLRTPEERAGFEFYSELIKSLFIETKKAFPGAFIVFVQQQVPGCWFTSSYEVYDRHPIEFESLKNPSRCEVLGQVFLAQDSAISSLSFEPRPSIIKMYLETVISDEGVYDAVHTNSFGSAQIGKWLSKKIISLLNVE
jgi:hypothetical protein